MFLLGSQSENVGEGFYPLPHQRGGNIRLPKKIRDLLGILEEKQAKNVVVLQLSRVADFTNYFIICSAESLPQVKAIAEEVSSHLPRKGRLGKEGFPASFWVLLDYGDFILHIFLPETRKFYALERIWADAPSETVTRKP